MSQETLDTKQAASFLGISESTLRQGRVRGSCSKRIPVPPFIRVGRKIIYLKSDLQAWLEGHRVAMSDFTKERV